MTWVLIEHFITLTMLYQYEEHKLAQIKSKSVLW
jgi:hypothetical protein